MHFTTYIKRLIYPLYIYSRVNASRRNKLHKLFNLYKEKREKSKEGFNEELRLFSNMEEDGIILKLLASLEIDKGYFIDIGSNDCINSNCTNLAFNFGWKGLFIDADEKLLSIGKRNYKWFGKDHQVGFVHSFLYPENINDVIKKNVRAGEIDFMSIDIDGNDFAIWKALTCVQPKIVVIENKIEYGSYDIVVPAERPFSAKQWGASIASITQLATNKGYTLVATNKEGFNSFYMRSDCFIKSGLRPLSVTTVLESDKIKKCFYPANVMEALLANIKGSNFISFTTKGTFKQNNY